MFVTQASHPRETEPWAWTVSGQWGESWATALFEVSANPTPGTDWKSMGYVRVSKRFMSSIVSAAVCGSWMLPLAHYRFLTTGVRVLAEGTSVPIGW